MKTRPLTPTPEAATDTTKLTATDTTPSVADFSPKALPPLNERGFLTTRELQKTVLNLSRRTLWEWRKKGIIPSVQIGSKILWHRESVIAALLRRQHGGVAQ
jgi:Helix-turn-helix domain